MAFSKISGWELPAVLDELLRNYNIHISIAELGPKVRGFVYECAQGQRHIIVADWLTLGEKRAFVWHELLQVLYDFPERSYFVNLDRGQNSADHISIVKEEVPMAKDLISELPGKLGKAFRDNVDTSTEQVVVSLCPAKGLLTLGAAIVVTDKRVLLIKAGAVTGKGLFAGSAKSFYFPDISSVDLRVGLTGGHLQISAAGTAEHRDTKFMAMIEAENSITFTVQYKDAMKQVASIIRERMTKAKAQSEVAASSYSLAGELAQLAQLLASGALTQDQFEAAKQRLLGL